MALANIAFPWLWPHWRVALTLLTGCMLAESLVVRPLAATSYPKALYAAAMVNLISTIAGWPLRWFIEDFVRNVQHVYLKTAGTHIFLLLFALTVLIEWPLYRYFLKSSFPRAFLISLAANFLSYLLLDVTLSWAYSG